MLLAVAALVSLLVIIVLHARVRSLRVRDRIVLGTLRALALLLVLGCLLRPGLVIASAVPQRNVFAVVFDDSRSMRIRDVADTSRLARVQRAFDDTASLSRALGERFALRPIPVRRRRVAAGQRPRPDGRRHAFRPGTRAR